jgi:hypothetical protein
MMTQQSNILIIDHNFMTKAFRQGLNVEAKAVVPVFTRRERTSPVLSCLLVALALTFPHRLAHAQSTTVNLGAAASYGVLAGAGVSSTGPTVIGGNLGLTNAAPTALTGFPPGTVMNGAIHQNDASAAAAYAALSTAILDASGRTGGTIVSGNLGGQTLTPGLYKSTSSLAISSGNLTLDAQGNPNAVFIFQMASTLTTSSGLGVILAGGANPANIFWQVGSSATIGTSSAFDGNILASASISLATGATLNGRALALTAVTLDSNSVTSPVPEPGTLGLFALGFGLFALRRRVNQAV